MRYQRQMQSLLLPPTTARDSIIVKYYFAVNAECENLFPVFHRPRQDCIDRQIILFCSQHQMQISSGAWLTQAVKLEKHFPLFQLPGAAERRCETSIKQKRRYFLWCLVQRGNPAEPVS
jgi:hypothetical protein